MNTKFDVGQRVTYPVVHTADGNITGIAVSKAGVTRYAIGPKWYTEDDLKPTAEEKPEMGNPITEPVKESEPVKLYCVKSSGCALTKGKVYEFDGHQVNYDGLKCFYANDFEDWKHGDSGFASCLVPLVRRPAKVGEWVLPCDYWRNRRGIKTPDIFKVESVDTDGDIWFDSGSRCAGLRDHTEYLVLDGYHGDPDEA